MKKQIAIFLMLTGCGDRSDLEIPEPQILTAPEGPAPRIQVPLENTACAVLVSQGQWYVYQLGDAWTDPGKSCAEISDFGTAAARPFGNSPFGEVHLYRDPNCMLTCEDFE